MQSNLKSAATALAPLFFAGLALGLSGCDDGPRTQQIYDTPHGSRPELVAAVMNGNVIPIHVVSSITGLPEEVAGQYAGWLTEQDAFLKFEFGGDEIPGPDTTPWVLILHDTPAGYTGISACQGTGYDPVGNPAETVFRTIICDESGRLVEVLAVIPRDGTDLDAAYPALLRETARQMITEEDATDR